MTKIAYNQADLRDHEGISALVKNEEGKILMFFHNKIQKWTIPVGKVDEGETPYESLVKEIAEEVDLTITSAELKEEFIQHFVREGKNVEIKQHLYDIKYIGEPKNNEPHKHRDLKFMSKEEIIKLPVISDATEIALKHI